MDIPLAALYRALGVPSGSTKARDRLLKTKLAYCPAWNFTYVSWRVSDDKGREAMNCSALILLHQMTLTTLKKSTVHNRQLPTKTVGQYQLSRPQLPTEIMLTKRRNHALGRRYMQGGLCSLSMDMDYCGTLGCWHGRFLVAAWVRGGRMASQGDPSPWQDEILVAATEWSLWSMLVSQTRSFRWF
jgi:hypothetical protein